MSKPLRILLICLAVLIVVPVVAVIAFAATFDANAYKDRIADAVRRATGRDLVIAGPLSLSPSLHPAIEAHDVSLANMPGGSQPQMATVGLLQARLALWPLLSRRVEIDSVTLVRPDILLETDAKGRGNWQFDRPEPPPSAEPAAPSAPARRTEVAVGHVHVQDGQVTFRNGANGQAALVQVPAADIDLGDGPVHATANIGYAGLPFALDVGAGTLAQMRGAVPGAWPVDLHIIQADAAATFDGTVELPILTHGYRGQFAVTAPDTTRFAALAGRPGLPPLHDVHVQAAIASAFGVPIPADIALTVGASDLQIMLPGLSIAQLSATMPKFGEQARLSANGQLSGMPWTLASGVLPAGGGIALRGMAATLGGSDAAGDLAITSGTLPTVRGTIVSRRLDLDAIRALSSRQVAPAAPASAAAPAPAAPAPIAPPATVIPDRPLPFMALRRANLDVQATAGTLRLFGIDSTGVAGHVVVRNGTLTLDPFTFQPPGGHVDLSFSADANQSPTAVVLNVEAAALPVRPLLQAFGLPAGSNAAADIDIAVRSAGDTPHALAAALTGRAGLAMVDGEVENALLASLLGDVLKTAGVPPSGGTSHVRCLALRLDAASGHVDVRTVKLDSARVEIDGGGSFDLGPETLALKLRPDVQLGGTGVLAPVQVGGTFAKPKPALDSLGIPGHVGVVIGGPPPTDTCPADLTAARNGRAGPLPSASPSAKRDVKPADLLRSFLR